MNISDVKNDYIHGILIYFTLKTTWKISFTFSV